MSNNNFLLIDKCCNLACTQKDTRVNSELINHSETFKQGIYKVADIFYLAVGYGLANITMVEGDDGIIIIDTGESYEVAKKIYTDFKEITNKPVKCIIYTHNHLDHIGGVKAFATKEQVADNEIKIYAHRKIMDGVINNASVTSHILNTRAISTYGLTLENNSSGHINDGIGPILNAGTVTFIHPTDFVDEELTVTVSGIEMLLKYAPSETDDEMFIYFPQHNLIQSADIIMGESFPNLYTIRGTTNRDPVNWYESIDKMRRYLPDYFIPSHGRPLEGKQNIYDMLTAYRDAIQYTHDQTVRYMNKGYTPNELVQVVSCLPDNLKDHPWLQEFYGTVKHSVKQIYHAYLGWFQGDPTFLDPTHPKVAATRYVEAFGGRGATLSLAIKSMDSKDYTWAAEVLTHLITADPTDTIARSLKSSCLRELAYKTKNTNWRNWYLTSAKELDNTVNYDYISTTHGFDSPDIINEIPIEIFLKRLCIRLDPNLAYHTHLTFEFNILPSNKIYYLEIRYCIAEFHDSKANIQVVDHSITVDEDTLKILFLKKITLEEVLEKKLITFGNNTTVLALYKFFSYFDLNLNTFPYLALPHL